jgi:hypothetical protein
MNIGFIHDDKKATVYLDLPEDLAEKAEKIIQKGFRFELEIMPDNMVEATVHDALHENEIAFVTCRPFEAGKAFERLIRNFNLENPYV